MNDGEYKIHSDFDLLHMYKSDFSVVLEQIWRIFCVATEINKLKIFRASKYMQMPLNPVTHTCALFNLRINFNGHVLSMQNRIKAIFTTFISIYNKTKILHKQFWEWNLFAFQAQQNLSSPWAIIPSIQSMEAIWIVNSMPIKWYQISLPEITTMN